MIVPMGRHGAFPASAGLSFFAAVVSLAMTSAMAVAAGTVEADIVLKPAAALPAGGLSVGLFAPDSTIKAPVESLEPIELWPVAKLSVALNANTGLCGDHAIAQILDLPNQEKDQASADGPECIFGAMLAFEAGPRKFEIATECGDWHDDSAMCWGYGQTGEFRLVRDVTKGAAKFRLVFPGPVRSSAKVPDAVAGSDAGPAANDPAAQKHGLFLDTLVDDTKVTKGDLWLVWTAGTVEITFTR